VSVSPAFADVAGEPALLLLRATLLMGAAWAAATALRMAGAPAAARHIAWLAGIAALLALPALWFLVPALSLPILPAEAATAAAAAAAAVSPAMAAPHFAGPVTPDLANPTGWSLVLPVVYALGATTLLLRLVVGRRTLRRLWSDASMVRDPAWEALLSQLSAGMRLTRRVELRISSGPAVPMTWGTLAPRLLLPAEASEWPLERRRLVLLHELAHVARRDSLCRSLASLACALYWFHPGAWFAARRMRMEQEHAADDRVLTAGGSAQAYARSLLHLAKRAGAGPRFDQAAAMAGMYQLERRLVSITSSARRNSPGTFFLSSSALLGGCTTLLVAAAVPVSATSTLSGAFEAGRTDRAPQLRPRADTRSAENLAPRRAGPEDTAGRFAPAGESAPPPQPDGAASEARHVADAGAPRRHRSVAGESEPASEESRDAQLLSNFGWELPRPDSRVRIASDGDPLRPARLTSPAPRDSSSNQRLGRPKWARNVPRIVQGAKPMNSPDSLTQGPLMLSFSLGGDGD